METITSTERTYTSSAARPRLAGPIVVATDGCAQSSGAFAAAVSIAAGPAGSAEPSEKLRVEVVTVCGALAVLSPEMATVLPHDFLDIRRRGMLATATEQVRYNVADSTGWEVKATSGPPAATIAGAAAEENASLIVMGLGKHDLVDRVFGSETALGVMQQSRVPVLAVPQNWIGVPLRVLIAVDFGSADLRAARTAMRIVAPGGNVCFAHVASKRGLPANDSKINEELDRFIETVGVPSDLTITRTVLYGDTAPTLLERARTNGIDMIVAGTHGLHGLARLFIGSVAAKLVRGAQCAILIASAPKENAPDAAPVAVRVSPTRAS